jgi:predicted alpha/beta superfamily hydrolase
MQMFSRWKFTIILLVFTLNSAAQYRIRLEISSLPAYHPSESVVYVAGSFNGWNPQDEKYKFSKNDSGRYYINLDLPSSKIEFKITRGGWQRVECKKGGLPRDNRVFKAERDSAISIIIEDWQDRFPPKPVTSTASKNVRILNAGFEIPELKRIRRIWIYIPHDDGFHKHPVLYMHDGQNLFDEASSFAGEWGIDEFLDSAKLKNCIVVGIDHGGQKRINEYSPYDMEKYGQGEGDQYVDFIVKTLKPYVDQNFPTLRDREHTYIAGSSMGGLISMYAVLKYPKVFGAAGIFSPAFWVAPRIFDDIKKKGGKYKGRIYFYAGKQESENMVPDMLRAFEQMSRFSKSRMVSVIRDEGKHDEATWRKEFGLFYQWLMDNR